MRVRTRFAPSPTGMLHVGSVRTALFSWLYARHHKGEFILRIEDTDSKRSTQEAVDIILEGMSWLGLNSDTEVYYQTKRYERYREVINFLLEKGLAYRCTCKEERLTTLREQQLEAKQKPKYDNHCRDKNLPHTKIPHVIRFKTPLDGYVEFDDLVYGKIKISNEELDDLILLRSDGHPTYNFAVVIDDLDMDITHVIRGEDHINNTPKQIHLFKALGDFLPVFAHLPMLLGEDGKKLSKRHGAVSVLEFKNEGVLPEALLNYLVRLGWSHGNQEIFSVAEMIAFFDLNNISKSAAAFQYDKLYWLNQHYQKTKPLEVVRVLGEFFKENKISLEGGPALEDIVQIFSSRCKTIFEIYLESKIFYEDHVFKDERLYNVWSLELDLVSNILLKELASLKTWKQENLHEFIKSFCEKEGLKLKQIAPFIRVATTGNEKAPSIDLILSLLGKEKALYRLDNAIKWLRLNPKKEESC